MASSSGKTARIAARSAQRSAARLGAVQALYQMDMVGTDANQVISEFAEDRLGEVAKNFDTDAADESYFRDVVLGVVREQKKIDPVIDAQLAEGWRLARVDSILRAILRSAAYELSSSPDVPSRVIINEYVDIAHAFFGAEEPSVVNGVLDHLARKWRKDEFQLEKNV